MDFKIRDPKDHETKISIAEFVEPGGYRVAVLAYAFGQSRIQVWTPGFLGVVNTQF